MQEKEYLGDGAYVEFDGFNVILTTSNGITETNIIYLEPSAVKKLLMFVEGLKNNE